MGMFSSSCSRCGSKEHAYEDCPHSMFSKACSKCGSTEHAFDDCPHAYFSKECSRCGSVEHAFEDCPHAFFSKECSKCGSVEHAFEDCPHSFFSKECSKCGSINHATHECPHGFFARPPRERARLDDSDDDDLSGGLIKLGLIAAAVVFIVWLVFNVILPFIAINAAIIALIASFVFKDRKSIILLASSLAGCFVVFDYNYGLFVSILQSSIEGSDSFIKYFVLLNFVAGLVSAYFIGEKIIANRTDTTGDDDAYSRNRSILIGALAFVGVGGAGAQYYVGKGMRDPAEIPVSQPAPSASNSGIPSAKIFNVRAHCSANPNDPGPGEQDAQSVPAEVRAANADFWRCAGGKVLVCHGGASGRACMQQETEDADYLNKLEGFCRSSPGGYVPNSVAGPGREWRCEGNKPIPVGNTQIDAYGFLVNSWRALDSGNIPQFGIQGNTSIDLSNEVDKGEIIARQLLGSWYDGGPGCASIKRGDIGRNLIVRLWYCESDESLSANLVMDYDNTVDSFVHEQSGLALRPVGDAKITIMSNESIRSSLGDGVYLSENKVDYTRQ
jgi:hypothetical protein